VLMSHTAKVQAKLKSHNTSIESIAAHMTLARIADWAGNCSYM
jgi:hypothetical protein